MTLEDRVAVVTGAGGAICGAIAEALGRDGARVAVWDLDGQAAEATVERIRQADGQGCAATCDVLRDDSVRDALQKTHDELGHVDILVNGAGGSRKSATTSVDLRFFDMLPKDIMDTLALNYLSAVLPSQAVGRGFAERKRGVILNIASIAGIRPLTRAVAYSNGKAGLVSFTQWLAVHMACEYSPAIRVNALAPGFVLTEQNRFLLVDEASGDPTERGHQILDSVPMGRYGQAQEMVGAALWLVGDEATYVTGAVIPVDGGLTAYAGV
jgi:NAD(P)-dependent dehydrogenase (short-subunit alcohol dehydrogenase family)